VNDILKQLELNNTFFTQLIIFGVVFFILSHVYFRPFMKLFEARHQKTVRDQESADRLMAQAQEKLETYRKRLAEERSLAKKAYDAVLDQARREESDILARIREDAKKTTQEAVESVSRQREALRQQLEKDVEAFANTISDKLLSKKN
jgi:F-type H+-transporting ATPase subunit b